MYRSKHSVSQYIVFFQHKSHYILHNYANLMFDFWRVLRCFAVLKPTAHDLHGMGHQTVGIVCELGESVGHVVVFVFARHSVAA